MNNDLLILRGQHVTLKMEQKQLRNSLGQLDGDIRGLLNLIGRMSYGGVIENSQDDISNAQDSIILAKQIIEKITANHIEIERLEPLLEF